MSLLTGFNISLDEVELLGQASQAAFAGGNIPAGWTVVTPAQLGLDSKYSDGIYFTDPASGASAIVLRQGSSYIVAFRGTDGQNDTQRYPELLTGNYIHHYDPLLNRLSAIAHSGGDFSFTGASLGGGATNLMAGIAGSAFGGAFAAAAFVAFASPNIRTAAGILNVGFENDPIYKAINGYGNFPSSLDNLVLATSQYMAGNYDGRHPFDDYAHSFTLAFEAIGRLEQSAFYKFMGPDSVVIFDANVGLVRDVTPGRENTGAFYLGQNVADSIAGRNGNDFLEGFGGNDTLKGAAGNDSLAGRVGNDWLDGGVGADAMRGGFGNDTYVVDISGDFVFEAAGAGIDRIITIVSLSLNDPAKAAVENLSLAGVAANGTGNALGNAIFGNSSNNALSGLAGNDFLFGLAGNDRLFGGHGNDVLDGGLGADLLNGGGAGGGSDSFRFSSALGTVDVIQDFSHFAIGNNDVIQLDDDVFIGAGPVGVLAATAFEDGPLATSAQDRILYDEATGAIYFDRDGTGPATPVRFATLVGSPNDVDNSDFVVIA